jgi:hypothetical protein
MKMADIGKVRLMGMATEPVEIESEFENGTFNSLA